jgi:hypothetical protein
MPVGVACPRPDLTVAVVSSIFVSSEYVPRLLAGRAEVVEGTVPEWPGGELLPLLPRHRWVPVPVVPWVRTRTHQCVSVRSKKKNFVLNYNRLRELACCRHGRLSYPPK